MTGDSGDTLLGQQALQEGLVTLDQLRAALADQARDLERGKGTVRPLADILQARGFLTKGQVDALLGRSPASKEVLPSNAEFGKYRLLRELGRGGMGIVYEALDVALGRKVAIKTLLRPPEADPEEDRKEEERFLREAQLAASLPKHPHIVGVYEAGIIAGRHYLAMELVPGVPLSEWRRRESVTPRQEVALLRDAALAVHHAHEHQVIHRDLKPQNILVDEKQQPHLTDFGLAKAVGRKTHLSLTEAGMVVGTPAYISPEQAQGLRTTDRRTDVYALGVILFEALTGRTPFQGENAMEILMKAARNAVPTASSLMKMRMTPALAQGLDNICFKALAKDPAERYPDAAAFAADLTRWLKGEEVKVQVRTRRKVRRGNRTWVAVLGAAALAFGATAILLVRPSEAPRSDPAAEAQQRALGARLEAERRAVEEERRELGRKTQELEAQALAAVSLRDPSALRPGLVGEYFSGTNFEIACLRRIDPEISFQWRPDSAWPEGPGEIISVRWTGYLKVARTGPFLFQTRSSDGVRLFVDDMEVLSNWTVHPATLDSGMLYLKEGFHRIVLEHFRLASGGGITFRWRRAADPAGVDLDRTTMLHDPAHFTPLARKAAFEFWDWEALSGAQEAETLPILETQAGSTFNLPFGRKKGVLIWGKNTKPQDRLKLQFSASEGAKTLIVALGRSKNSGIVRIAVNGKVAAPAVDLFHPSNAVLEMEFRNAGLRSGSNEIEFTMLGTNPAATEWRKGDGLYKMSFDYLRFR